MNLTPRTTARCNRDENVGIGSSLIYSTAQPLRIHFIRLEAAISFHFIRMKAGLDGTTTKEVINIPSHNLIVFSCFYEGKIRVFKDGDTEPDYIFDTSNPAAYFDRYVQMMHL